MDLICIGEGEEIIPGLLSTLMSPYLMDRRKLLTALSTLPGIYIPRFHHPRHEAGKLVGFESEPEISASDLAGLCRAGTAPASSVRYSYGKHRIWRYVPGGGKPWMPRGLPFLPARVLSMGRSVNTPLRPLSPLWTKGSPIAIDRSWWVRLFPITPISAVFAVTSWNEAPKSPCHPCAWIA